MHPIYKVNLPKLSDVIEHQLLEVASKYESFKYNTGTLGNLYYDQKQNLNEIEEVINLYGFDHIPQHRSNGFDRELRNTILNKIGLSSDKMYVQVIESRDSFIHTDGGHRKCSLYYLISDNTPSVTKFYKSSSKPIISTVYSPKDVTEYFSYEMKQHEWHVFNHDEIHSVNNIKGLRVGLILDMTNQFNNYENFIDDLKDKGLIDA